MPRLATVEAVTSPRVSVIIIFLNGEAFLEEAIDSVLAQSYDDFELLLCDDGSAPPATAIARRRAEEQPARIRYLEHPGHENQGMSATRNMGVNAARGEFIAFIDADDAWKPEKLADQVAIMDRHPDVMLVGGQVRYWHEWSGGEDEYILTGSIHDRPIAPPSAFLDMYPFGAAPAACPSDLLMRRAAFLSVGGNEPEFRGMYEDQAFLAKFYLAHTVYYSSKVWLNYRQHSQSAVAGSHQQGTYAAIRTFFFNWFEKYLHSLDPAPDPRVYSAFCKARDRHRRHVAIRTALPRTVRLVISVPARVLRRLQRVLAAS